MEKAYFEVRRKFPDRDEYAYLRLALASRYAEKPSDYLEKQLSNCESLDDVIVKAVEIGLNLDRRFMRYQRR